MLNSTGKGWTNEVVDNQRRCTTPAGSTPSNFGEAKTCSYRDQKRGFKGTAKSGPITFHFTSGSLFHCIIWIGEPNYEWAKPLALANWESELEVTLNGEPCKPPHCMVKRPKGGYLQTMVVDARAQLGGKCRHVDIDVALTIKPADKYDGACTTNNDHQCEASGSWKGYNNDLCKKQGSSCVYSGRRPAASLIHTFVSQVISF
jgi:hypothetical protein